MSVSVDINDQEVVSALQSLQHQIGNTAPVLKQIGELLIDSTRQRFQTTTDPDGNKWDDNSAVTLQRYARRFKTKRKQRIKSKKPGTGETKQLRTQISYNVNGDQLEWGSPLIYAATFNFGAKQYQFGKGAPWGDIPAREFLGLSDTDRSNILDIIRTNYAFS